MSTPREQIGEALEEIALRNHPHGADYCDCKIEATNAILAIIKGLPAMQEERKALEHVQLDDEADDDTDIEIARNDLRRQILAELESES